MELCCCSSKGYFMKLSKLFYACSLAQNVIIAFMKKETNLSHPKRIVIQSHEMVDIVEKQIIENLSLSLELDIREITPDTPFMEIGVDSIIGVKMIREINERLAITLSTSAIFNYTTVKELTDHIFKEYGDTIIPTLQIERDHTLKEDGDRIEEKKEHTAGSSHTLKEYRIEEKEEHTGSSLNSTDIAVIGIGGCFAGARNVHEFWNNLAEGKDSITESPETRRSMNNRKCYLGGFLEDIEYFDPLFFNFSGIEAELSDPQQRLFLQECWNALEDAGYATDSISGKQCGVFVGVSSGDYLQMMREEGIPLEAQSLWGNTTAVIASRISYFLNLRGPSLVIDTACSSSLVAVHTACKSINLGECDMAIAGGVFLNNTPLFFQMTSNAGVLSPDGKCRAFDDDANGFVPGECVGAVILKSLRLALQDRDHVYGVIKGSAVNQDGKTNGISAPSVSAQTELESTLYEQTNINPETITYIEAHGTGTKLGDPIEIEALTKAFSKYSKEKQFCAIGSVKTNIGHTANAAGIASLIKVLLSLKHRKIPASLNFIKENQHIRFRETPFFVNTTLLDWKSLSPGPLRSAINSFGLSGTNCHLIVEQAPNENLIHREKQSCYLLPFSAMTNFALLQKLKDFEVWLQTDGMEAEIGNISYTLQVGRHHFPIRATFIVRNKHELQEKIRNYLRNNQKSETLSSSSDDYMEKIATLAELYVKGDKIDWQALNASHYYKKISLPTYPFEKIDCWPGNKGNLYYRLSWQPTQILSRNHQYPLKTILLFTSLPDFPLNKIDDRLNIILVCPGTVYRSINDHTFQINPLQKNDYYRLYQELKEKGQLPTQIIHWLIEDLPDYTTTDLSLIQNSVEMKILTVFYLVQMLLKETKNMGFLYFHHTVGSFARPENSGIDGFLRSIKREIPGFIFRTIGIDTIEIRYMVDELFNMDTLCHEIRYINGERCVKKLVEFNTEEKPLVYREGGVYLITGGNGSLGLIFAKYLAQKAHVKLALLGRSALDDHSSQKIQALERQGAEILYQTCDVSNHQELTKVLDKIRSHFGPINGIIHSAGVIRDASIFNKTADQIREVIASKIYGTIVLDICTKDDNLDFFVMFSSIASVMGSAGQSDYAYANGFMDEFVEHREKRSGKTIAINWPLWEASGMKIDNRVMAQINEESGLLPMPLLNGLKGFETAFCTDGRCLILYGEKDKLRKFVTDAFNGKSESMLNPESFVTDAFNGKSESMLNPESKELFSKTEEFLKSLIAEIVRFPVEKIQVKTSFSDYGIDSIMILNFNSKLENTIGTLPKTLLFEYENIRELTNYFINNHTSALINMLTYDSKTEDDSKTETDSPDHYIKEHSFPRTDIHKESGGVDIAVIGIGGMYPDARNPEELWQNLLFKKNAIREIPSERWDFREAALGPIYCKYGGFIEDVDKFDPLFFKITPVEAATIIPEERLMMQVAYSAIEDAGYTKDSLKNRKVGVFLGMTTNTYSLLSLENWYENETPIDSSSYNLSNRISYFMNFTGPSIVVDTACSSSLVSVHMAVNNIKSGECQVALAGGVNLYLHPSKYLKMCKGKLLARGQFNGVFDATGNGFIPGEGVGALLLKPLANALKDGDNIYGVIKASQFSHKGRSNGYFIPSPQSRANLLRELFEKSGLSPREITYIEAQGIGSETIDAVEWKGMTDAFSTYTTDTGFCGIGSLEGNIGHLEAASGVAQVTKVLFQMKYGKLVPTHYAQNLNPGIITEDTPFYLQNTEMQWEANPRRAVINSFGAGGADVSLIVEEAPEITIKSKGDNKSEEFLIPISAMTEEQLTEIALQLKNWVESSIKRQDKGVTLKDISFTLHEGRDTFQERLVIRVDTKEGLLVNLNKFLAGGNNNDTIYRGSVCEEEEAPSLLTVPSNLVAAAESWVQGARFDWAKVHGTSQGKRISLPTYPFERRRCWRNDSVGMTRNKTRDKTGDIVEAYYDKMTTSLEGKIGLNQVYLVFAPFPEPRENFSWLLMFFEPFKHEEDFKFMIEKQKELKSVLYRHVDFSQVKRVMDIGCGYSADIIDLAMKYTHIKADGYTISQKQADFGLRQIQKSALENRVRVYARDTTQEPFPKTYDLFIGFEVLVHIENKKGVFENITSHLKEEGYIVLADCIANTVTEVDASHIGQYTITEDQYAQLLAENSLQIVDCVDASLEISNFLDDPNFETNLAYINSMDPGMVDAEKEHRGWHNFGRALRTNIIRYVLLTIKKANEEDDKDSLTEKNQRQFKNSLSYIGAVKNLKPKTNQEKTFIRNSNAVTDTIEKKVQLIVSKVSGIESQRLKSRANFIDYGIDSLQGLTLIETLNKEFGLQLALTIFFDYPSIQALSEYLSKNFANHFNQAIETQISDTPVTQEPKYKPTFNTPIKRDQVSQQNQDIAVIGMSGRFPGARNCNELWENLKNGVSSISEVPPQRQWVAENDQKYLGGFIDDFDLFDSLFFNISPAEAEVMDPQHRLFLEEAWKALEDAGYPPDKLKGIICGVYAGIAQGDYLSKIDQTESRCLTGNVSSMAVNRIAYLLDLHGPCMAIDTACSSALSAVHLGCRNLVNRECDLVLAGGAYIMSTPQMHAMASTMGILSISGKCTPFDTKADGWILGEAVGVVILKRLSDAINDKDPIYGVIKSSAVGHNGTGNGLLAPKSISQAKLQQLVYQQGEINPEKLGYIETQGSSNPYSDLVEIDGLKKGFSHLTAQKEFCALGTFKPNIGHSLAASGIVALIKVLMALKHKQLPPSIGVTQINEELKLKESPFYVNTSLKDWPEPQNSLRTAAINTFAVGGSNCYMVIEEFEEKEAEQVEIVKQPLIWTLSAKTGKQLKEYARLMLNFLQEVQPNSLINLTYTLQTGRKGMEERMAIVFQNKRELEEGLNAFIEGNESIFTGNIETTDKKTNMLLQGTGGWIIIDTLLREMELEKLAMLWCEGAEIPWESLYEKMNQTPRRISLPVYPFAGQRYWISDVVKNLSEEVPDIQLPQSQQPDSDTMTGALMIREKLITLVSSLLKMPENELDADKELLTYGFDSLHGAQLSNRLEELFGVILTPMDIFNNSKINLLVDVIVKKQTSVNEQKPEGETGLKLTGNREEQGQLEMTKKEDNLLPNLSDDDLDNLSENDLDKIFEQSA